MRVSKEEAAENKRQLVRAAAKLFREHGISDTGVDSITHEAGLTHGAVYSQFGSKEAIVTESVRHALQESKQFWLRQLTKTNQKKVLDAIVEAYLSAKHRDAPGTGCIVAALGGEIARQSQGVRDTFTEEFKDALKFLADLASAADNAINSDDILGIFVSMAGGLMLARAVSDPKVSANILETTLRWICRQAENPRKRRGGRGRSSK